MANVIKCGGATGEIVSKQLCLQYRRDYAKTGYSSNNLVDTGNNETKYYSASFFGWSDTSSNSLYLQGSNDNTNWSNVAGFSYGTGTYPAFYRGTTNYRYFRLSATYNRSEFSAVAHIDYIE